MENLGQSIKKVSIYNIKPNMVLANDAVTENGVIILPKNTMINNVNYTKLKSNQIKSVYILVDSIEENKPNLTNEVHTLENQMKPVTETEEFQNFSEKYTENLDTTKNMMIAIGTGSIIDKESIFNITDSIMNMITFKSDIFSFFGYLKDSDSHIYTHSINVSLLANLFGKWLNLPQNEIEELTVAGLLHDIGKIKVDPDILNKKGALTPEEFDEVKKHTIYGYEMVQPLEVSDAIKKCVLMHHEKMNGTGYPLMAKSDSINKITKIISICDIYDAMTSNRTYRNKICPFEVIRNFERDCFGLLSTEYLLTFLQNIAYTYIGSWVKLTNGEIGEVLFINRNQMSRPVVKVGDDFIDLSNRTDISIEHII